MPTDRDRPDGSSAPAPRGAASVGDYGITTGTYEEALGYLGRVTEVRHGDTEVNTSMGRQFAAAVRDGNPLWWDPAFARATTGDDVVPPATLLSWVTPLDWKPDGSGGPGEALVTAVPLPGGSMMNVSNETEYFDHLRAGDRYSVVEEVETISAEKQTAAGRGHFLTVAARFRRQDGTLVAIQRNVLFRFTIEEQR